MLNKNIVNQINGIGLKMDLEKLREETYRILNRVEIETLMIDIEYQDKLRDMNLINKLQEKQAELIKLVNHINDVEMKAIAINDHNIVFKCENVKADVIDVMEYIRNKYMF